MSRPLESITGTGPSADDRPTVIFMHIPKTAGLTFGDVMLREYGRGQFEIVAGRGPEKREAQLRFLETGEPAPPDPTSKGPIGRFRQLPEERRAKLRALMGHFVYGMHEAIDRPSTYLTLVRDPIDRVLSAYNHRVVRQRLNLSVEEYIRSERDHSMHNGQVHRIAGRGPIPQDRPGRPELDRAKRHIEEHFTMVGLTDRFDESLILAGHLLGWRRLTYRRQNEGPGRPRREDLAPDLLRILERNNELDEELVAFARERFQRQLDASGLDIEREVARLRRRNSFYRWVAPRQARTGPNWKRHPVERTSPPPVAR
jgi:hypothetical protein